MTRIFLHGLESSSKGSKATYLRILFPDMLIPDFKGKLSDRMSALEEFLAGKENIIMAGSSFGGLMATIYAMEKPETITRMILLAPALNFPDFSQYTMKKIYVPTTVIIGSNDTVTPAAEVLPLALNIYACLKIEEVNDDHMLARTFRNFDWQELLAQ